MLFKVSFQATSQLQIKISAPFWQKSVSEVTEWLLHMFGSNNISSVVTTIKTTTNTAVFSYHRSNSATLPPPS